MEGIQKQMSALGIVALFAMMAFVLWGTPRASQAPVLNGTPGDITGKSFDGELTTVEPPVGSGNRYRDEQFGFSLWLPDGYAVEGKGNIGDGHRAHYAFVIIPDNYIQPQNGEGPTAITLDIFQNLEGYAPLEWVKGSNDSNWKLGDGRHSETSVAGRDAIAYRSSGLYEATNYVFADGDAIYKLSVTWFTEEDQIVQDFGRVKDSFAFEQ